MQLKMKFKKPKVVESLEIIDDRCTGCGSCVAKCKKQVFTMNRSKRLAVISNIADCVGCGKCVEKMCNFGAIELKIAK